jgi:hypothetical protein
MNTAPSFLIPRLYYRYLEQVCVLILNIISTLEPFNPSRGIHHFTLTGKKRMALAAEFHSHFFPGSTYGKPVAASAYHFGIFVILRVYLLFHIF